MSLIDKIGEAIRKLIAEKNIKQDDIASNSPHCPGYVSKVINSKVNPKLKTLENIICGMGYKIEFKLVEMTDEEKALRDVQYKYKKEPKNQKAQDE